MKNKTIAQMGLMVGLAFILSYLESMLPLQTGIPGAKLGLANIVMLTALVQFGTKEAFFLMLVRTVLSGFTFGSLYSMAYSLSGGFFSILIMSIMYKTRKFSIIGISVAGGVTHNIGQLMVAMLVLKSLDLKYYAGFLVICGAMTGLFNGVICKSIQKHLKSV